MSSERKFSSVCLQSCRFLFLILNNLHVSVNKSPCGEIAHRFFYAECKAVMAVVIGMLANKA